MYFVNALATPDQSIKASTASNQLTRLLLKGKLQNVKTERNFASCSLSWNLLLEWINAAFPDILFLPYVCQTGLAEVSFCYIAII